MCRGRATRKKMAPRTAARSPRVDQERRPLPAREPGEDGGGGSEEPISLKRLFGIDSVRDIILLSLGPVSRKARGRVRNRISGNRQTGRPRADISEREGVTGGRFGRSDGGGGEGLEKGISPQGCFGSPGKDWKLCQGRRCVMRREEKRRIGMVALPGGKRSRIGVMAQKIPVFLRWSWRHRAGRKIRKMRKSLRSEEGERAFGSDGRRDPVRNGQKRKEGWGLRNPSGDRHPFPASRGQKEERENENCGSPPKGVRSNHKNISRKPAPGRLPKGAFRILRV